MLALLIRFLDLGASVGALEKRLCEKYPEKNVTFYLIDNSKAMLEKAKTNLTTFKNFKFHYLCKDISNFPKGIDFDLVVLNYTLQFTSEDKRKDLLIELRKSLKPGGYLVLSEKTSLQNPRISNLINRKYHEFKKLQGYSVLEIARKKEALNSVLISWSKKQIEDCLKEAGFRSRDLVNQSFQFGTWFCQKRI